MRHDFKEKVVQMPVGGGITRALPMSASTAAALSMTGPLHQGRGRHKAGELSLGRESERVSADATCLQTHDGRRPHLWLGVAKGSGLLGSVVSPAWLTPTTVTV